MPSFQVKLGNEWKDYSKEEDKILKRAFMAGFPTAKFHLRGQDYTYDFKKLKQINKDSGKERDIRAPWKWKQPKKPIVPPGRTTVVSVPAGAPGTTIQVPYPGKKDLFISVNVPKNAKVGQTMLVPVPPEEDVRKAMQGGGDSGAASGGGGGGYSTGGKVAAAGVAGAVVGAGALVVAAGILGADGTADVVEAGAEAVADAAEDVADVAADVGEDIAEMAADAGLDDFAADAGEFFVDVGEDIGDFVMDLF